MDGWALVTALGLLAAFAGLSLWVRRRAWGLPAVDGALALEARVPLGPGVEVLVVAWGEQRLLLASDADGVRLLGPLDQAGEAPEP